MQIFDDFFIRALVAGVLIALVAAPVGCNIIWRRMAFFGDTLAHSALLGVVLAVSSSLNIMLVVFCVAASLALALSGLRQMTGVASDAILGLLAHATLALALVLTSLLPASGIDVSSLLFGDILAVSKQDILVILIFVLLLLLILVFIWRPLFAATVSVELAEAEGASSKNVEVIFLLIVAAMVALSIKLVGALLITALLIIPPAAARSFASSPERMAVVAAVVGMLSVIGGLHLSLYADTPAGPSIVLCASLMFVLLLGASLFISQRSAA